MLRRASYIQTSTHAHTNDAKISHDVLFSSCRPQDRLIASTRTTHSLPRKPSILQPGPPLLLLPLLIPLPKRLQLILSEPPILPLRPQAPPVMPVRRRVDVKERVHLPPRLRVVAVPPGPFLLGLEAAGEAVELRGRGVVVAVLGLRGELRGIRGGVRGLLVLRVVGVGVVGAVDGGVVAALGGGLDGQRRLFGLRRGRRRVGDSWVLPLRGAREAVVEVVCIRRGLPNGFPAVVAGMGCGGGCGTGRSRSIRGYGAAKEWRRRFVRKRWRGLVWERRAVGLIVGERRLSSARVRTR